jgi:hypothetical protein
MLLNWQERKKEDRTMKERMTKNMTYLGVGAGLVLFAIYGLLPGSFLGGIAGLNIVGSIFGTPVEPGIIARIVIALSMLLGVMVSGAIFVTISSAAGWLIGSAIDVLSGTKRSLETVESHKV